MTTGTEFDLWKAALVKVRTQIADFEREGTSTPGKLKRKERLRNCRMALRDIGGSHAEDAGRLRVSVNEVEQADKDDDWRRIARLIPELLRLVDGMLGSA